MKSALPGVLLVVAGALVTYWALTKLGLFVPAGGTTATGTPTITTTPLHGPTAGKP